MYPLVNIWPLDSDSQGPIGRSPDVLPREVQLVDCSWETDGTFTEK